MIPQLLFYVLAFFTLLSAMAVISLRNPVNAVLSLIFCFFNAAGLFLLIGAEFIAMILIIVYVGAVMVLFLFVVMMLNVNFAELRAGFLNYLPIGLIIAGIFLVELFFVVTSPTLVESSSFVGIQMPNPQGITNTEALGNILYTDYVLAFQVSGLILLVAMIGAIVLTLRTREGVKKQDVARQVNRPARHSIRAVGVEPGSGV